MLTVLGKIDEEILAKIGKDYIWLYETYDDDMVKVPFLYKKKVRHLIYQYLADQWVFTDLIL